MQKIKLIHYIVLEFFKFTISANLNGFFEHFFPLSANLNSFFEHFFPLSANQIDFFKHFFPDNANLKSHVFVASMDILQPVNNYMQKSTRSTLSPLSRDTGDLLFWRTLGKPDHT